MAHRKTLTQIAKEVKVHTWADVSDGAFRRAGITRAAATRLEHEASFRLVWPWDPHYSDARKQYDPAYQEYPMLVGYPETAGDVAWLLNVARALTPPRPITCRSGGHSTAGYAVLTGGIVVDMSHFNHVVVDPVRKLATVGPGTTFRKLNKALDEHALHVPGGDCDDVCIGGYMQGGGFGLTSREFGINCDNVVQVTMLTYDAKGPHIATANAAQNPRLFWAVRGGTGNQFGVLLDVTYKLYPLGPLWGFGIKWSNIADAPAAIVAMQNGYMKQGASPKLGQYPVMMVQDGDTQASLGTYGMYNGPRSEGLAALRPLLATGNPKLVFDKVGSYRELNAVILPNPHVPPGVTSFPPEVKQSAYIAKPIDLAGWTTIVNYFATRPNDTNAVFLEPYGGAINRYPATGNAFIHRDVYMDFYVDSFWFKDADQKAAEAWLDGYMKLIAPYSNGEQYQNYPRRNTPNYAAAFWGSAYPTLQAVKAEYDPLNVFKFPMGITPAPPSKGKQKLVRLSRKPKVYDADFEKFKKRAQASRK